jgi:hypothetical protein
VVLIKRHVSAYSEAIFRFYKCWLYKLCAFYILCIFYIFYVLFYVFMYFCTHCIYRVIHKSIRDFRPLRYSSRDGHAEGEHANRGRDIPSFCPTLQFLDMCTLGDAADVNPVIKFLRHDTRCNRCTYREPVR